MPNHILQGHYDYRLVSLSVVIAILAAGAALDLAGRTASARGGARLVWMTGGAVAMGLGIWSMHYIGMLAFDLCIPVQYDWPTVLLSLLAAIAASGVALFVVSGQTLGFARAVAGSVPRSAISDSAINAGMVAIMTAATPEGTRCSAQNSRP